MSTEQIVPVEQCDRDAYADYLLAIGKPIGGGVSIRLGHKDDLPGLQFFAEYRHRLQQPTGWAETTETENVLPRTDHRSGALLQLDDARLVLFQAIRNIQIGNPTDDKLILEELRKLGYWIAALTPAPIEAGEVEHADTLRLDWLDQVNTNANERNGTRYGWKYDINHNRAALTDHNWPPLSIREAIDAAMSRSKK